MANLDRVTTPDGQTYNIIDSTSGYVTSAYVQSQIDTINKNSIGLGNVDNTSDLNKPVSTAQQTAIDNAVAPKVNKTDIATVESGTTASRAYSVGELVYVSGALYRVKTAIARGSTFTVGTNIEAKNVSDAIDELLNEKTTLCTYVTRETTFVLTSTSQNYAVQHNGVYCIEFVSQNNTPHDMGITCGRSIADQYVTYMYQRINVIIPLKAGTQLTFNGAVGDAVIINYGYGNI